MYHSIPCRSDDWDLMKFTFGNLSLMILPFNSRFPNLGILHVTRKDVKKVLKSRMLESKRLYNSVLGNRASEKELEKEVDKMATEYAKNMDLSVVKLNFTAYLPDDHGNFNRALAPVMSVPVYDCSKLIVFVQSGAY